jgi:hypothetical protein
MQTRALIPTTSIVHGLAALVALSCAARTTTLTVNVTTDFVPGAEMTAVRVDVEELDATPDDAPFSERVSFVAQREDDFLRGVDVASLPLPRAGRYRIGVALLDSLGEPLARQSIEVIVRDAFTATILVTRSCVGVTCPADGDAPDETVCLGGRCVTPECARDPEDCPDGCGSDLDCAVGVDCAVARCIAGECFVAGRPAGTPGACDAQEYCDPETGCTPFPSPVCEEDDEALCALQEGVCAGASVRCVGGTIPDCGSAQYGARFETAESLCDGLDNDCDGVTDEMVAPECPLQSGVCAGSRRICAGRDGYLACDYAAFDARYEPIEQSCDGVDNDCDGSIDELARTPTCPLQDGVCARSRAACVEGSFVCTASEYGARYEDEETRCDGLDNDCDRLVDEALDAPPCALQAGVCAGRRQRCAGALGFAECRAADYGLDYEASETRCDGLDNDCDGVVDEGITRACDRGCGAGVETCVDGVFQGCDAPSRSVLRDVSLAPGAYAFACLDVPERTLVELGPGSTVTVTRDARIHGELVFRGADALFAADELYIQRTGILRASDITLEARTRIRVEAGGLVDAVGRYSGGGGGGCSSLTTRGVTAGGGGGADGGAGGRGGGCGTIAGLLGGSGIGEGSAGGVGCGCTCSEATPGGASSGGQGAAAPGGAGGGGGAGGRGGNGSFGEYPISGWRVNGGLGGAPANARSGLPTRGGGGGGGGGADIGVLGAPDCASAGGGGGGVVVLRAPRVENAGRIGVDGAPGVHTGAWSRRGASGGGGGGLVIVEATTLDNLGVITASGGQGGYHVNHATQQGCMQTSSGGAGGGGGGFVYLRVGALTPGSFERISVSGGAGGWVECSAPPGEPGQPGVRCCAIGTSDCPACGS